MPFAFLTLMSCIGGSLSERSTVPDGIYANSSRDETITVEAGQIQFHVVLIGDRAGQVFDRSYRYRVFSSGQIQPYPVRSADAAFGIGNFVWQWNGAAILQQEAATGRVLQEFTRSTIASPPVGGRL